MEGRTPPRRLAVLSLVATVLGLAGGAAAFVLIRLIALLTNLALFRRVGWTLPDMAQVPRGPLLVVVAMTSGLVVSLLAKWSPEIRGHGIPEAMDAVLTKQSRIHPRTAVAKPLSAAIAIGAGGPFGAEGPIIVTGGALGSLLGQVLPVSPSERKILLASGRRRRAWRRRSVRRWPPSCWSSSCCCSSSRPGRSCRSSCRLRSPAVSTRRSSGPARCSQVRPTTTTGSPSSRSSRVLGVCCGLLAVVITRGLFLVEAATAVSRVASSGIRSSARSASRRSGSPSHERSASAMTRSATCCSIGSPSARWPRSQSAKLLAWWVALGSGTSGGTLAPDAAHQRRVRQPVRLRGRNTSRPASHIAPGAFALVAMAATFGAAVGATFAADRVPVRADARLPDHPAADVGHRHRRRRRRDR